MISFFRLFLLFNFSLAVMAQDPKEEVVTDQDPKKQSFSARRVDYQVGTDVNQTNSKISLGVDYSIGLSNLKDIVHSMSIGDIITFDNTVIYGVSGRAFVLDNTYFAPDYISSDIIGVEACTKFHTQNSVYLETSPGFNIGASSQTELDANASVFFDGSMISFSPKLRAKYSAGPSVKFELKNDASLRVGSYISLVGLELNSGFGLEVKDKPAPAIPSSIASGSTQNTDFNPDRIMKEKMQVGNIQIELYTPKGKLVKRSIFKADTDMRSSLNFRFQVDLDGYRQFSTSCGIATHEREKDFNLSFGYKTPISEPSRANEK
jgi:hypothetical protein